jgi:hypothetical protein
LLSRYVLLPPLLLLPVPGGIDLSMLLYGAGDPPVRGLPAFY